MTVYKQTLKVKGSMGVRVMYFLKKCNAINKFGLVSLPKKWRVKLGFEPGTLVEIRMNKKEIWIYRSHHDETENQRYISTKGTVTIPAEFRNLLNIDAKSEMHLYVDEEKQAFVLKYAS